MGVYKTALSKMRTCVSCVGTATIRQLSTRNKNGCRSYTHASQPLYKVEQPVGARTASKSGGWVIPAALAIVGLGVSTFSTQKLVSGNSPVKIMSTTRTNKS